MERIEFVRKVALGAGYVAVMGCVAACTNKTAKTEKTAKAGVEPKGVSAGGFNIDLNDPKYADLNMPGAFVYHKQLIIARTNDGDLVAYDKKCTHKGGPLAYDAVAGVFQCPWHGSQFTGKGNVMRGPATEKLKAFNVETKAKTVTITPKG